MPAKKALTKTKTIKLNRFAGQWVGYVQGKVVAHSQTLKELMMEIKHRNLEKKTTVFLEPRPDEGPYILLWKEPFHI